jgi:hypothetical protein
VEGKAGEGGSVECQRENAFKSGVMIKYSAHLFWTIILLNDAEGNV